MGRVSSDVPRSRPERTHRAGLPGRSRACRRRTAIRYHRARSPISRQRGFPGRGRRPARARGWSVWNRYQRLPRRPGETTKSTRERSREWGNVEIALATHYHGDHFDPDAVARFLVANPEAVFISTPQAVERLRARLRGYGQKTGDLLARVRAVLPAEGAIEHLEIDGINIQILNLHHGRRTLPVENLGFVVTLGDQRFLHFGDTEAKMAGFEPYLDLLRDVDLALLPFWFLSSDWRAEMVRNLIQPDDIVVAHLPTPDADAGHFGRWQSHENLVGVIERAFPRARTPRRSDESYRFDDD
ncbi:MAG: hypothetical protein GY769_04590 [bacterium]|nr:hypothetical protein [bacterium]